jgi:signal transduction histidine kinase
MKTKEIIQLLHELNNILCACSGFSEILLDIEDRAYQRKLLEIIVNNLVRMDGCLENVRDELYNEEYPNS